MQEQKINGYFKVSPEEITDIDCKFTMCGQKDCKSCYPKKHSREEGIIGTMFPELLKWVNASTLDDVARSSVFDGGFKNNNQAIEHLKNLVEMDEKVVFNKSRCSPQCFCDGSCKKPQPLDNNKECLGWQIKRGKPVEYKRTEPQKGKKETDGKLNYEISWRFIEEMAKRMQNNKGDKYPPYNWKKPIDVEDLKQAINRHHIEVMEGNYKDGDEELGHVVSYACNAMMLWWQLKNNL